MVVVSILPHVEFGPIDHRKDVPHFILEHLQYVNHYIM